MALVHIDYFSQVLGLSSQAAVILPEPSQGIGQAGAAQSGDAPVLWLLHGGSDDHTIWQRRTSIERYVAPLGLAVVMPAANLSYYSNMVHGPRYFDYIAEELPELMRGFFHLSARREDNFMAGLSMGGYGAFKFALSRPQQYAAAASLSGVLDLASHVALPRQGPLAANTYEGFRRIFGGLDKVKDTEHDLFHLLEQAVAAGTELPALFASCGTEDFLYQGNRRFVAHAQSLGVPLTYHEEPGEHEWGYWDRNIQRVLEWLPLRREGD